MPEPPPEPPDDTPIVVPVLRTAGSRSLVAGRLASWTAAAVPAVVAASGAPASRRFLEFFAVTIRNPNTRMAYYRAARRFFGWCETHGLPELADIEPLHVAAYIEELQSRFEKPTTKLHLASLRMLFDWLVTGQVIAVNPAHAVKTGKTTVLNKEDTRRLLDSIDVGTVLGLRDRALIAVMTFGFARVGAVVAMRLEDYYPKGKRWWIRLHEKGGKRHEMPAHHTLESYLDAYVEAAGIAEAKRLPLFRATGITAYLEAGGTLENAQLMAAHESPRTTKLYDRTGDNVTLDEIERIII